MGFLKGLNKKWVIGGIIVTICIVLLVVLLVVFINPKKYLDTDFPESGLTLAVEEDGDYLILRLSNGESAININQRVILGGDVKDYKKLEEIDNGHVFKDSDGNILMEINYEVDSSNLLIIHVNRTLNKGKEVSDCFEFGETNWWGGPEQKYQYYPVQKLTLTDYDYLPKELDSSAIMERYWLNSDGMFVYISDKTPLFINQNSLRANHLCFTAKSALPFDTYSDKFTFNYTIGVTSDARTSHMEVVKRYLHTPTDYPDERMATHPIWSTWVRYGRSINQSLIIEFANEIIDHGFKNAQLDIDDFWETCYGSLTFDTATFPSVKDMTDQLKELGFRSTLWIHPFINKNCLNHYSYALDRNLFVTSYNGSRDTKWWNSGEDEASYLDFTNPGLVTWFKYRLDLILAQGIDSFKFDAGETSWGPDDPKLFKSDPDFSPTQMTVDFVRSLASYGPMIEIRTGQGTQDLPVFVRMLDLDSRWDWNNGLPTLIPTLLQMNLNGYAFVLPDMIGGNRYNTDRLDKELFMRWVQATVFMPAMQFSVVPWDFDEETIRWSRQFTELHETIAPLVIERFKLAVATGEPVNLPIWWVDPHDKVAQGINDGEDYIRSFKAFHTKAYFKSCKEKGSFNLVLNLFRINYTVFHIKNISFRTKFTIFHINNVHIILSDLKEINKFTFAFVFRILPWHRHSSSSRTRGKCT